MQKCKEHDRKNCAACGDGGKRAKRVNLAMLDRLIPKGKKKEDDESY